MNSNEPDEQPQSRTLAFLAFNRLRAMKIEALLPLILAVSGFVGVLPFIAFRSIKGEYAMAFVNVIVSLTFAWVAWSIFRYQNVRTASAVMAAVCAAGLTTNIYFNGSQQIYWAFPLIVGMFFLLKPWEATALIVSATALALPPLLSEEQSLLTPLLTWALALTMIVAAAFSALTVTQRRRLRAMALMDPLTGACNRRAMDETIAELIAGTRSTSAPLAFMMLDIDHFKRINDQFGHAAGDRVLVAVAECIQQNTRATDHFFRVGGEEFAVVVAGAGLSVARRLSESLREAVAALEIPSCDQPEDLLQVTVSLGVAEWVAGESADQWYKRADDALYEAKRAGRNRTFIAGESSGSAVANLGNVYHLR